MDHANGDHVHDDGDGSDADAILAELEAEEDQNISSMREERALHANSSVPTTTIKQEKYVTLTSDDDTLQYTTEHEKAVVHFFHPDFARCSIMDEHLTTIAQKHADYGTDANEDEINFARVDVRHAEFVVQKLNIRVLPCVIGFAKGQIQGRIVGFEGVSWGGKEKGLIVTRAVEEKFVDWKILKRSLVRERENDDSASDEEDSAKTGRRGITGRKQKIEDEDDDWD